MKLTERQKQEKQAHAEKGVAWMLEQMKMRLAVGMNAGQYGQGTVVEAGAVNGWSWMVIIRLEQQDLYRITKIVPYVNRALNVAISVEFSDYSTLDEAQEEYLKQLEYHGGLAFGDVMKIQKSGSTFIERTW